MGKGFCVREYVSKERPTKIRNGLSCDPGSAVRRIYLFLLSSCDKVGTFHGVTEGINIHAPCAVNRFLLQWVAVTQRKQRQNGSLGP